MTRLLAYGCATVLPLLAALAAGGWLRSLGAVIPDGAEVALGYVIGYAAACICAVVLVMGRRP